MGWGEMNKDDKVKGEHKDTWQCQGGHDQCCLGPEGLQKVLKRGGGLSDCRLPHLTQFLPAIPSESMQS